MDSYSSRFSAFASAIAICGLAACGNINDSWEVKGGGYIKYQVNNSKSYTIELGPDDVEIPYIRNRHHYFLLKTRIEESERGDIFSIMADRPVLGDNAAVTSYTWMQAENSPKAYLVHCENDTDDSNSKENIVTFDMKNDSTWTADIDLCFVDCRTGKCKTDIPPLHVTGRIRYWIPEDYR